MSRHYYTPLQPSAGAIRHDTHAPARAPNTAPRLDCSRHDLLVPGAAKREAGGYDHWWAFNPSVCVYNGALLVAIRLLDPRQWAAGLGKGYVIGYVESDWSLGDCGAMQGVKQEDLRLFVQGDRLRAIGSVAGPNVSTLALLDLDENGGLLPEGLTLQPSSRPVEKNWMPCVMPDESLKLVYQLHPLTVIGPQGRGAQNKLDAAHQGSAADPMRDDGQPRGGSQLVPYTGGDWLAVIHTRFPRTTLYTHCFARFSPLLHSVSYGPPFSFESDGIEFCAGLARYRQRWVLSYGVNDQAAKLAVMTDEQAKVWIP